jgi:hypothetical protein
MITEMASVVFSSERNIKMYVEGIEMKDFTGSPRFEDFINKNIQYIIGARHFKCAN